MTMEELWVRFMEGALASGATPTAAAMRAYAALMEYVSRWPADDGGEPEKAEEGATREG